MRLAGREYNFGWECGRVWRQIRHAGKSPDFLLIGAQKAGTTSLYDHLCASPDIWRCPKKEIHFFNQHYKKGVDWYRSHFPDNGLLAGEATPNYCASNDYLDRIASLLPDVRLIYCMRDPVRRLVSEYTMWAAWGKIRMEPDEYVAHWLSRPPEEGPLRKGFYDVVLESILERFDRKRLFLAFFEEFITSPEDTVKQAWTFLDARPAPIHVVHKNKGRRKYAFSSESLDRLGQLYKPHNARLEQLLEISLPWQNKNSP